MTDEELAKYLGFHDDPNWPQIIADLPPQRRGSYERMALLEVEIGLWQKGLGPKPKGVLINAARTPSRAKGMVQRLKSRMLSR